MTIATAVFLIAIGAILRYAVQVDADVIDIQTVGLILMIAGGAGLALSLLYELIRSQDDRRDEYAGRRYEQDDRYYGPDDRSYGPEDRTRRLR